MAEAIKGVGASGKSLRKVLGDQPHRPGGSRGGSSLHVIRRRPLADEVRDRISADFLVDGTGFQAGDRLPSEVELSRRYGISRVTLRAALRSLQEVGFISIRHGSGATILPRTQTLSSSLDRLCSIETLAREAGGTTGSDDVEIESVSADERVAEKLEISVGEPATVVRRVKTYHDQRVAYMVAWIAERICPTDRLRAAFKGSVLDVLLEDPTFGVEYADCEITSAALDRDIAERLHIEPGVVALYMEEVMRSTEGLALEWGEAWFLPEHFRFALRRRR